MTVDQFINVLAAITLFEMMVTIGLGVTFADVVEVGRNWGLVTRAAIANYILVPAAALGLLLLFHPNPMVSAGFLVAAVCPGAPYGPPFTAMAKGNVAVSVGLMVILAGSSAIFAPLLLHQLLPLISEDPLNINLSKMVGTLLGAQLLPMSVGLWVRHRYAVVACRIKRPASILSTLLNLSLLTVIIFVQFRTLAEIRLMGYVGMLSLVIATMLSGWLMSGQMGEDRKGMVLTTSVRNVGVGLVIVTASFPATAAITSATAYALFQTVVMALVAVLWGRLARASTQVKMKAA